MELTDFIAKLIASLKTLNGILLFSLGLLIGYAVARSPLLVIGAFIIIGIVLFVLRDRIDLKDLRSRIATHSATPSPQKSEKKGD